MGATRTVVVAGGDDPIPDEAWQDFSPGLGNVKNQNRNLLFEDSCFWRSPAAPASCQGDACRSQVEIKGYTWVELAEVLAMDCIPKGTANCGAKGVPEGALTVTVTRKCHELVFEGDAWILSGPSGERAIMHAIEAAAPTGDVSLPDGWTLERTTLTEPLVVHPFGAEGDAAGQLWRPGDVTRARSHARSPTRTPPATGTPHAGTSSRGGTARLTPARIIIVTTPSATGLHGEGRPEGDAAVAGGEALGSSMPTARSAWTSPALEAASTGARARAGVWAPRSPA